MSIEQIVAMCVPVIALVFTVMSFKRLAKKDTSDDASERATMSANISYIRSSIDEIKLDNRAIKQELTELQKTVAKVEQSVSSAHKRIDDLKKG